MNRSTAVGLGLIVAVMIGAIVLGGTLMSFIDLASLTPVTMLTLGGTLFSHSMNDILGACMHWLKGSELDEAQRERSHEVFTQMANFASVSGAVGTVIGLTQMLQNLSDPSAIGPAMAVALLSLLYAVLMGELVLRAVAERYKPSHSAQ